MNWPKDNDGELDAFYSRPDGSARWEIQNLTYIFPPWKAYLAGTNIELKNGIRVHKRVAASLESIFASLWETFGKSQEAIEKVDLHQIGGAYYFRARRGSKRLSNHARGIAIDIDPQDNQMGRGKPMDMDPRVVAAFEAEGWRWGKAFNDPMHFEAVWNGKKAGGQILPRISDPPAKPAPQKGQVALALTAVHTAWIAIATPRIKVFEDFRAKPYWDKGQWSNGFGQKCEKDAAPITIEQASINLANYLAWLAPRVAKLIKVKVTPNQGAALLSFAYNLGDGRLASSTLLKKLNAGDYEGAAGQFNLWCKARNEKTGKLEPLPGLVKRREAERQLFLS